MTKYSGKMSGERKVGESLGGGETEMGRRVRRDRNNGGFPTSNYGESGDVGDGTGFCGSVGRRGFGRRTIKGLQKEITVRNY